MRVAVTGAGGRLGRALVAALQDAPFTGPFGPLEWRRQELDLDAPEGFAALLDAARPEVVVHAAAWTDVDGCARDPELAMRRNGEASGRLAAACAARGIDLVLVSTNEVFDGRRIDGQGYGPDDAPAPANPYGRSKLDGERRATAAFSAAGAGAGLGPALAIVRTAWLFGPPGGDFPDKILVAAERARAAGEPLRAVSDEVGTPTFTRDLADAIVELLWSGAYAGVHHCVNAGVASRAAWARELLERSGVDVDIEEVPSTTWPRASTPPPWGVLLATPLPSGEPMRPWPEALADDLAWRLRARARSGR